MRLPQSPAPWLGRTVIFVLIALLVVSCTGTGGGWLPPNVPAYTDQATFGFTFSCERSSKSTSPNPPTGRLKIQLDYTDHGTNPLGGPFSVHGEADVIDSVLESAICLGQNPPPGGQELIFLGTYYPTSSSAGQFGQCVKQSSTTGAKPCRFEVIVRDNDGSQGPSVGDFFSIKLSSSTVVSSELAPSSVIYARAGVLGGGKIDVN